MAIYNPNLYINVKDAPYSAVGNGIADDTAALDAARNAAALVGKGLYFPIGTYLYLNGVTALNRIELLGETRNTTTVKGTYPTSQTFLQLAGAKNITISGLNIAAPVYTANELPTRVFDNVTFYMPNTTSSAILYYFYDGIPEYNGTTVVNNCLFDIPANFVALGVFSPTYVSITNNTFSARCVSTHVIRIYSSIYSVGGVISNNKILGGGTTGIFFGSQREAPVAGYVIDNNEIHNITEEGIAFDSFGNNPPLIPVICNGQLSTLSNDANGRLVVSMTNMLYHDNTTPAQPSPVSLRSDWTKFYFVFSQGTGIDGTIAEIYSYDSGANTITLNIYTLAASITATGFAGVHTGFFNNTITNNRIFGAVPANKNTAVGISVYLNVFNTRVENNIISGFNRAIIVYGGFMVSTYHCLAYYNTVQNNTVVSSNAINAVNGASIEFASIFGGINQIGNKLIGNNVVNGGINLENQKQTIYRDNIVQGGNINREYAVPNMP
jgi:hypothetical protein